VSPGLSRRRTSPHLAQAYRDDHIPICSRRTTGVFGDEPTIHEGRQVNSQSREVGGRAVVHDPLHRQLYKKAYSSASAPATGRYGRPTSLGNERFDCAGCRPRLARGAAPPSGAR
jgi:hypothetical protein